MDIGITIINNNFIALLALIVSLVSFGVNYINMKGRRNGEKSQHISDYFTKLLIIKNQLNPILATYEQCCRMGL